MTDNARLKICTWQDPELYILINQKYLLLFFSFFISATILLQSVQLSCSVISNSLRPHGLQYARPPCSSPTPGVYPNSCPLMPSNHLILCCPLLLLPSIFPSITVSSNESVLHIRWQQYWSFSLNISPSKEHLGLISFRIDWFDLLKV